MPGLIIKQLGLRGVVVDKDPLEMEENELLKAQNAIKDTTAGNAAIRKRPGLLIFNTTTAAGPVLGGVGVPLLNLSVTGLRVMYIGRDTTV